MNSVQNGIFPFVVDHARQRDHQQQERQAIEDQAEPELAWNGRIVLAHPHPQPGQGRREKDDGQRVHRLEPRYGEVIGAGGGLEQRGHADVAIHDLVGEEVERTSGLLEEHPEQHVEHEDGQHRHHLVARYPALDHAFAEEHHRRYHEQAPSGSYCSNFASMVSKA
jgi:hypothetical protein